MVLYLSQEEFDLIHTSLKKHDISLLKAKNILEWHGLTIQNPDGFKVVIVTPRKEFN